MRHGRPATSGSSPEQSPVSNHSPANRQPLGASGKVVLAAIVHHDTIRSSSTIINHHHHHHHQHQVNSPTKQTVQNNNNNTHDEQQDKCASNRSKFSRLFSRKKPSATLIDKAPPTWSSPQSSSSLSEANNNLKKSNEEALDELRMFTSGDQPATTTRNLLANEQVIEFKFDLIVDQQQQQKQQQHNQLDEHIHQLIESFVLDSGDVCLMSTGKETAFICEDLLKTKRQEFSYLCELARSTLEHSFELLATQRQIKSCDNYSIELSANLLLSGHQSNLYSTIDLLDGLSSEQLDIRDVAHSNQHIDSSSSTQSATSCSIDCLDFGSALNVIKRVVSRLTELESITKKGESKLLLLALKLKRRINGGLFTNRMCLIDFDPNFLELQSIFESIFNGQALAHLKRHKLHLQSLESMLSSSSSSSSSSDNSNAVDHTTPPDAQAKQLHLVASERKLIQVEWLLYKQLSSALIRTLLVVHVHKLAGAPGAQVDELHDKEQVEYQLMRNNLVLLEFARKLQRASAVRLRRRKRNLKSHLASSNVSVASNASASSTTNDFFLATCSTPQRYLQQQSHHHKYQDQYHHNHHHHRTYNHRKNSLDVNLALDRLQRRHNKLINYSTTERSHQNDYHRTNTTTCESSSLSTSSGSGRTRPMVAARSRLGRANHSSSGLLFSSNNLSDSDSITSANLNSCSSSSNTNNNHNNSYYHHNHRRRRSSSSSRHHNSIGSNHHHHRHHQHHRQQDIELRYMSSSSTASRRCAAIKQVERNQEQSPSGSNDESFRATSTTTTMHQRSSSISNVIQIDCYPAADQPQRAANVGRELDRLQVMVVDKKGFSSSTNSTTASNLMDEDEDEENHSADNVSDICSVIVAEPPKQLKLEEFLNQLSSIIAPSRAIEIMEQHESSNGAAAATEDKRRASVSPTATLSSSCDEKKPFRADTLVSSQQQQLSRHKERCREDNFVQPPTTDRGVGRTLLKPPTATSQVSSKNADEHLSDEDEDCKSHSSILDHLTSLAMESNNRLNSRVLNQPPAQQLPADFMPEPPPPLELNCALPMDDCNTGHLQKLLNSSLQLRATRVSSRVALRDPSEVPSSVEEKLRALSIMSSGSSSSLLPTSVPESSPSSSSSGAFTTSDSVSSTSSSSTTTDTQNNANSNNSKRSSIPKPQRVAVYSVVTSNHHRQNVKT